MFGGAMSSVQSVKTSDQSNQSNHHPARQLGGSEELPATLATNRAFLAADAGLVRRHLAMQSLKTIYSFITMVTVAPVVAVATLVLWNPERWGGSVNPLAILVMSAFGLFTVPLWPTYIPAVAATPFLMRRVAHLPAFRNWPLPIVLVLSFALGVLAGVGVISIIVPWGEPADLVLNWIAAGGVSGGFTLTIISCIFRYEPKSASKGSG